VGDLATLERRLETVADFAEPRVELEQYATPPALAARLVHRAALWDDLDRPVVDLGSGTGRLALGAALAGAPCVLGVERDRPAIETARENERRLAPPTPVMWLHADAIRAPLSPSEPVTVLMNPPFGAQDGHAGADRAFLGTASAIAAVSYSAHNAGSLDFLESFAADAGGEVTHAFAAELTLDRQFPFHDRDSRTIAVEIVRIAWDGA
jgi:putative methylase